VQTMTCNTSRSNIHPEELIYYFLNTRQQLITLVIILNLDVCLLQQGRGYRRKADFLHADQKGFTLLHRDRRVLCQQLLSMAGCRVCSTRGNPYHWAVLEHL